MTDQVNETAKQVLNGITEGLTTEQLMDIIRAGASAYAKARREETK